MSFILELNFIRGIIVIQIYAAGALAGLTGLVYWAGYRAQGSRNKKTREWTGSELDL